MQAAARFERGESISQVARALRVSVRQVEKWRSTWRTGGIEALRSTGPASPPRLTGEQFARLNSELRRGPGAHGWDVDQRWTLARIVTVTERLFGVSYTLSGMSVLLRRNGWSVQVPARQAVERDETAIQEWTEVVWPQVKTTAAARQAWVCFEDEAGQGLRPPKGRTWARRGDTPVVRVRGGGGGRVNIAGLVCYRPGNRSRLIYRIRPWRRRKSEAKSLAWTDYRDLLLAAHQQLGAPIVLVWDNLATHKMPPMREFIDAHADWLTVVYLPAYAPQLNPAEGIWSMLKASLVNFAARNLDHLTCAVKRRLKMIQYQSRLIDGCLTQTQLTMDTV
jgi:transposase